MKQFTLIGMAIFLAACQNTPSPDNSHLEYLDLSVGDAEQKLKAYWVSSRDPRPYYPEEAINQKASGCTEVKLAIDPDGKARKFTVVSSFPQGLFDATTIESLSKARWKPAATNSQKVPVITRITLDYYVVEGNNFKEAKAICGGPA